MKSNAGIMNYAIAVVLFLNTCMLAGAQDRDAPRQGGKKPYTIEQAVSDGAQLNTLAFNGLAFITGTFGADSFFPPGKVADFFGFQYMRDTDEGEMGHNTDFLTRIASNIIQILSAVQLKQLIELANIQAPVYDEFAQKRLVLIKAFRTSLESRKNLNKEEVIRYCAALYALDAELSYDRAIVVGRIIHSFTGEQKTNLAKLKFGNSLTWPVLPENLDKRSLSHRAHVAVMTYASELFSWYAGSVKADVYFCPERHGTYFGGFYMKDYPAMGNPGYSISTSLTGDKGKAFLEALNADQAGSMHDVIQKQAPLLREIVKIRETVSTELRKAMNNEIPDKVKVISLITRYGELDGEMSFNYATCYSGIYKSLTDRQLETLVKLRDLKVSPEGAYIFSDPVGMPQMLDCGFLLQQ